MLTESISLPLGTTLVQALVQLGQETTGDADVVRGLLVRFGINEQNPPKDAQIVEIFSGLGKLAAEGSPLCDIGSLVRALSSFVCPFSIW